MINNFFRTPGLRRPGVFVFRAERIRLFGGSGGLQLRRVRVPLPIVILATVLVVAAVWWRGTRGLDFLSPPDETELAAIRERVESSMPQPDRPADSISVPEDPPPPVAGVTEEENEPEQPSVDIGDLASAPGLRTYSDRCHNGAPHLIELASMLESEGEFQRALLAWERVLDLCEPTPEQAGTAVSALRRLRPTLPDWNIDPEGAIPVVLHAATASAQAKRLQPVLEQAAKIIERASSGILAVKAEVSANPRTPAADGPAPIALRVSGAGATASTEVLSFRPEADDAVLAGQLAATVFQLVRNYLDRTPGMRVPEELAPGEPPAEALEFRVTRLVWEEFGRALNASPPRQD